MKIQHHPGTPCNQNVLNCYEEIPLIDEKWGFSFPQRLEIELTRKCNLNCIHCWNNSSEERKELPFELIKPEIDKTKNISIKLTGGEPLLYDSLIPLLELSKERENDVEMISNGTLINKENSNILKEYINEISISLHGSTKEIHETITRKAGSYNKTINAIKYLQDRGLNPIVNYTVMRENINDTIDMILLAKDLGVKGLRFNLLRNCGRGKTLERMIPEEVHSIRKTILNNSNIGIKLERSELYTSGYLRGLKNAHVYGCGGMRNQMYLSSDGNVYPCNLSNSMIGNMKQNTIKDIWNNEKASDFRKKFICPEDVCTLKERCAGKCKV